jgi:hypothetical protein
MKHSMSNGKLRKPSPKYSFCRHRFRWAVYDNDTGSKVCDYFEREEARKKVYELNGWNYKSNK